MITIERRAGYLRYNFSRKLSMELFNQQQFRVSAKLEDTPDGRTKAEGVVSKMKLDYLAGNFDTTLVRYGLKRQALVEPEKPYSLEELVEAFLSFKSLADSTRHDLRRKALNILKQAATEDPYLLFNWVKRNRSTSGIKKFVSLMKEAVEWQFCQEDHLSVNVITLLEWQKRQKIFKNRKENLKRDL